MTTTTLTQTSVRNDAWISGGLAVVAFSGSLPATRIAVLDMSPWFLTGARATIAAVLGALCLWAFRAPWPKKSEIGSLLIVAGGTVIGFPLLTAIALQTVSSVHSIVFTGLLPLSTALFATLLGEKRPTKMFWLFSGLGAACILAFAAVQGFAVSPMGDLLMLAAIIVCGLGYAEGGRLGRRLGGWQVICWALLIALPVMGPVMMLTLPADMAAISWPAWLGLGYVSIFSMLIGFFFWYRGLSLGGIAAIGQLQLIQPFLALILAALLLKEPVGLSVVAVMLAIVACVFGARKFSG
ncbi:DMT family transporter [Asticcacaulis sp. ZE23SCel15]|uniref:DMT family transporter n=1 Tax=Asticcacaulis sp. ZE23SCel15 TaxID=3059027 RepID=UPI00265FF871|nr:DMT family transporter [Asticcacaulis sp. ZE23SCel15]WKL57869.1 DMT family transporter [Asticcacaulis sp. ZE23SCel15]